VNIKFTGPGKSKIQLDSLIEESEKFRDVGLLSSFSALTLWAANCDFGSSFVGEKRGYVCFFAKWLAHYPAEGEMLSAFQ